MFFFALENKNWSGDGDRESIFVSIHEKAKSRFLSVSVFFLHSGKCSRSLYICIGLDLLFGILCVFIIAQFCATSGFACNFPARFFYLLIVLPLGLYTAAREISADNYLQGLFYVLKRRIIMYK